MLNASDLATAYRNGASLAELAALQGCSVGKVRDALLAAGVPLRPAGGRRGWGDRWRTDAVGWAARCLAADANVLAQGVLEQLPPGVLAELDVEVAADIDANCLAAVVARTEPALATVMAREAATLTDDSTYARAARKLARLAAASRKPSRSS